MSSQSKETLLQVSLTEDGEVEVFCPDRDRFVMAMTNKIVRDASLQDQSSLDVFFAINVHMLAMDSSGQFAKDYIRNLETTVDEYRRGIYESNMSEIN